MSTESRSVKELREVRAGGKSSCLLLLFRETALQNVPFQKLSLSCGFQPSSAICIICTHKVASVWIVFNLTVLAKSEQLDCTEV